MVSLATQAVKTFNDLFDKYGDPRVDGWLLMSSPLPTLAICLSYVYLVKVLGPKIMENRKPFTLRKVLIFYNAIQVIFSAWLFYECLMGGWLFHYSYNCQPVDYTENPVATRLGMSGWFTGDYNYHCQPVDYSKDPLATRMVHACWWYYFSKFTEFFDTIFFVLRKKNEHVSTLHVIHHGVMPMSVWFGVKFTPGGHSTFFGLLNTFVHIIMYFYYMVAAMGPQYQKYIWWKKYLTSLQMIQFVGIMTHAFQLLFIDCNYPRAFVWWIGMHAVLFFWLFSDFYKNTYRRDKHRSNKAKGFSAAFAKFVPCNLQMDKLHSNGHVKTNGHISNGMNGHHISNGVTQTSTSNGHASAYYINGDLAPEIRHREAAAVVAGGN